MVPLQGAGQEKLGIYIKSVVKGGAADNVSTAADTGGPAPPGPPRSRGICAVAGRPSGGRRPAAERGRPQPGGTVAGEVRSQRHVLLPGGAEPPPGRRSQIRRSEMNHKVTTLGLKMRGGSEPT